MHHYLVAMELRGKEVTYRQGLFVIAVFVSGLDFHNLEILFLPMLRIYINQKSILSFVSSELFVDNSTIQNAVSK